MPVRNRPNPNAENDAGDTAPGEVVSTLRYDERPVDSTPLSTADLPDTPQRHRRIPATAWLQAPDELVALGLEIGTEAGFIRRIFGWLVWRAGPATGGEACYLAVASDDLSRSHRYRLNADGSGSGTGPSGLSHTRFRAWKEDLRDHPRGEATAPG